MPAKRTPIEELQKCVDAYRAHGNKASQAAADSIGLHIRTFESRLAVAAARGLMLDTPAAMPGYRIAQVTDGPHGQSVQQRPEHGPQFEVPAGHQIKGVSALVAPDGSEIIKWIKTREGELDPLQLAEQLKATFADYAPPRDPTPAPQATASEKLTLVPLADFHIGMFAWHREVDENWDLKIAEEKIGSAIEELVSQSPASGHGVVLGGGDLLHSDTNDNKTAKSGNALQVDGRYQKCVLTACRLVVRTIDAMLRRHEHVTARFLPGNHDEHAAVAVAYFVSAWFRNEPRVTVDTSPSLYWWLRFGNVLLGATHGHTVKIEKMPGIMAHRRAAEWGATRYRYVHGFHLHHSAKYATEGEGVISEIHQAPIPQDAWHYGAGFLSGRSVQAITYHERFGEIGRVRVAMLDGEAS